MERALRDVPSHIDLRRICISYSGSARGYDTKSTMAQQLPDVEVVITRRPTGRSRKLEDMVYTPNPEALKTGTFDRPFEGPLGNIKRTQ